jgi:hypothetical protein
MVQRADPDSGISGRPARRPARRSAPARAMLADLELPGPLMLAVFVGTLMIPGSFGFAGVRLSPTRAMLVLYFIPLAWRWVNRRAGPITGVDLLILLYCGWAGVSIIMVHGSSRLIFVISAFVEIFGGYLVGRTLIRDAEEFRRFFRYIFIGLMCLLPFALIEFLTTRNLLRMGFGMVFEIPPRQPNLYSRLGFFRAQTSFEHPILFGLFCAIVMPVVFFVFRESLGKRLAAAGTLLFMAFMAISSGPLLTSAVQILMISWDRLLAFLQARWILAAVLGAVGAFFLIVGAQFNVIDFIINNLAFGKDSASARVDIFVYGLQEVWRHPVFGIGLNEWRRPFWRVHPTVDNFWLLSTMRYGIPSLVFLVGGLALHAARIMGQAGLDEDERAYRSGYMIGFCGLLIMMCITFIWGNVSTYMMTFLGAGAWFYANPAITARGRRVPRRLRAAGEGARPAEAPPEIRSEPPSGTSSDRPSPPGRARPAAPRDRGAAARVARIAHRRAAAGSPGDPAAPPPGRRHE